jgi:hypothetical protein
MNKFYRVNLLAKSFLRRWRKIIVFAGKAGKMERSVYVSQFKHFLLLLSEAIALSLKSVYKF